ncbi:CsbD family protein [uncultured Brevundimonas sp.]|uniref:CsbD family protein n=1 Tax=uncultured Brevundimonas sp. TaxID=213418 RepID=UPI0030EF900E|tara:strand:+ start:1785 stop:2096 length:312 start_codon:yes stop_codon:yes gene_type:complete
MIEQRIEGTATEVGGKVQTGLGKLLDEPKLQIKGRFNQARGKTRDLYGQGLDRLDRLVERAPTDLRDPARTGLDFARRKPLLTTAIVAGLGLLLAGAGAGRRR